MFGHIPMGEQMSKFALAGTDLTDLQEKVLTVLSEELEMDPAEFSLDGHFVDDYDADSLTLIAVVARIEKELGVVVPKSELARMVDLRHTFELVDTYAAEAARSA